ncbi:hypothetical protein CCP3SC15_4570001 [Gammaproteobacteria bacterium]
MRLGSNQRPLGYEPSAQMVSATSTFVLSAHPRARTGIGAVMSSRLYRLS